MIDARWAALVVELPQALEDEIAGVLGAESLGVEIDPAGDARSRLRIYVASRADAERLAARASAERQARGISAERWSQEVASVEDQRWAERYQASLRPFRIGERFLVIPNESAAGDLDGERLHLVPGMAFGTGEHPTTRLCVAALERTVAPGSRWLDLGSGSGILALVAARCGAGEVVARDNDPETVPVALETVRLNGLERRIRVETGSAGDLAGGGFDGVVANIAAEYFLASAGELAAAVRPSGLAVVSGFLAEAAPEIDAALARAGFLPRESAVMDGWAARIVTRAPAEG